MDLFLEISFNVIHNVKPNIKLKGADYANKKVIIPLPDTDFDPTEGNLLLLFIFLVAVPWKLMTLHGLTVEFATETGKRPQCDQALVKPEGFVQHQLSAESDAISYYKGSLVKY